MTSKQGWVSSQDLDAAYYTRIAHGGVKYRSVSGEAKVNCLVDEVRLTCQQ